MPQQHPNTNLAINLRAMRLEHGWSQEELAERCGLHRTYVGAIERGERNVTLETLNDLASAFGVSAAELISEKRPYRGTKTSRRVREAH